MRVRLEKIALYLSGFAPSIEIHILVPEDRDSEEYIDELLWSVLDERFRYNYEWGFI